MGLVPCSYRQPCRGSSLQEALILLLHNSVCIVTKVLHLYWNSCCVCFTSVLSLLLQVSDGPGHMLQRMLAEASASQLHDGKHARISAGSKVLEHKVSYGTSVPAGDSRCSSSLAEAAGSKASSVVHVHTGAAGANNTGMPTVALTGKQQQQPGVAAGNTGRTGLQFNISSMPRATGSTCGSAAVSQASTRVSLTSIAGPLPRHLDETGALTRVLAKIGGKGGGRRRRERRLKTELDALQKQLAAEASTNHPPLLLVK